jgi:hypothetical protein
MVIKKNNIINLFILSFVLISYFVGFFLKDFAPGGASSDFQDITWPLLQSFKKDFYYSISNYGAFGEGSYPLYYIINSYLNPFSNNQNLFLLSITFISFIGFLLFSFLIKKNTTNITFLDCLLTSSIILILPFYRSSAYWGTTENLAWLFLILSFYFFLKIKNNLSKGFTTETIDIIYYCFFSSCALYIRPALIFWPISFFLYLFLVEQNKKIIVISAITYLLFAVPGFILILFWGDIYDSQNMTMNLTTDYHNYKNIIKNIPILLSYFSFYFLPFLIIELIDTGIKNITLKYFKIFIITLLTLIGLWQFNFLNYLGDFTYGGGAILKLNYLIRAENFVLLLISSALGSSILFQILKENFKTNISILFPIFVIYGFPAMLFQEYVEPLILFLVFSGILQTNLYKNYFKNIFRSNLITILYFALYLFCATYYKHFI